MAERVSIKIVEVEWNMAKVLGAALEASKEIVAQDINFDRKGWVKIIRSFYEAADLNRPAVVRNNYGRTLIEFTFPPEPQVCEPIDEKGDAFSSVPAQLIVNEDGLKDENLSMVEYLNRVERVLRTTSDLARDFHLRPVGRSRLYFPFEHYASNIREVELNVVGIGLAA